MKSSAQFSLEISQEKFSPPLFFIPFLFLLPLPPWSTWQFPKCSVVFDVCVLLLGGRFSVPEGNSPLLHLYVNYFVHKSIAKFHFSTQITDNSGIVRLECGTLPRAYAQAPGGSVWGCGGPSGGVCMCCIQTDRSHHHS